MTSTLLGTQQQESDIREILSAVASTVSNNLSNNDNLGLLSGLSGQLLFLFNAYHLDSNLVDERMFAEQLDHLQEKLHKQSMELGGGLAGQAWLLEYLNQSAASDYDSELMEGIDTIFSRTLLREVWPGELEMVLGLAGYAPFIARRARYTYQGALYAALVRHFSDTATRFENGQITWSQPEHSRYRLAKNKRQNPEYNLGLAHGVPGIIAALLPAVNIPELKLQVSELLEGSCDWLLAQQNPDKNGFACFGALAGGECNSRLGWCYGDLSIALTVARTGKALGRPDYLARALEIALHASKRDARASLIYDSGLCHGFVGLMLMYQVLNQVMPHPQLEQAAKVWLDFSLKQYRKKGIEAFYAFDSINQKHKEDFSFLTGYAGVGLAFIGILNNDTDWTDCLLLT